MDKNAELEIGYVIATNDSSYLYFDTQNVCIII